ncbi:MAG: sugar ABC transporter permease [Ignavibacteriae bacterium HGW-Ignavibacteriae-2]|nr:MAG: sugar ABC transporter permease [Ignavibacteriae bacterium HGW-Ignavibacteriae-2]
MKSKSNVASLIIFLGPSLFVLCVFFFIPVLAAFVLSFTDFDIYSLGNIRYMRFVGIQNYLDLLNDPLFWIALKNTFYFVLIGGPLSVFVSLGAAVLLNSKLIKYKGFFRIIYFLPVVTTLVAVSIVWRYIYHPRFGLLNYVLGFVGLDPIDWLGDPNFAMPAIIIMAVWKNFGYNMIIFIAGLNNIPEELYESASLEGANAWQKFRNITIPMLAPTTLFISVITMIGYFQLFAEPYIMTQGGPLNSTLSIVLYMYHEGFRWWNIGYSTTIAFVLFLFILIGTIIQFRLQKEKHV